MLHIQETKELMVLALSNNSPHHTLNSSVTCNTTTDLKFKSGVALQCLQYKDPVRQKINFLLKRGRETKTDKMKCSFEPLIIFKD